MTTHQLYLWAESSATKSEITHHFIEVVYRDGKRRVIDTGDPNDQALFSDMSVWSAEFVAPEENKL